MKIITASGGLEEVGFQVGRASAEEIRAMLASIVPDLRDRLFGGDAARLRESAAKLLARAPAPAIELATPFLAGMARGAGVDHAELLALSMCEELSVAPSRDRDRCSTLAVWTDEGWLIGHQEDYVPEFYGRMLVYDLRIDGFPRAVSLNYPGLLPNLAGSLNEAGLALVNNALWPEAADGYIPKQPSHFLASLQGGAHPAREAAGILRWSDAALTDHFLIADAEEAYSLEVSNEERATPYFQQRPIRGEPAPWFGGLIAPFVHTNSVRWLKLKEPDPAPHGSQMRFHRLSAVAASAPPKTAEEMLALLMTRDGIINRDAETNWTCQPNSVTLASIVIRPRERKIAFAGYPGDQVCGFGL